MHNSSWNSTFTDNINIQRIFLILILTVCLIPFLDKAFHIDDPLFIWSAHQIMISPFDFYGFTVNWYEIPMPMYEVMQNPPFTSYFIALVGLFFGTSEVTLHLAFLLVAIFCSLGIFELARELRIKPLIACMIAVFNPAFFISATNIMSDVLMLGFWVWSIKYWLQGINENRNQ